ncbi:MAG TPA: DNA gyrase subunit A [Bacillota bacterium]|jgi:DNA gyrase subunit A
MADETVAQKIVQTRIVDEMKKSYIDYAMSVIIGRALPDVRDGLKPVHRRILYSMYDQGFTADKPYRKSAKTVGDVIGRFHPHGDAAVYDTIVRLAQVFSMRDPLIDGHGNFGSVDGDPPAAMRYTECRLSRLAGELLRDIDKKTVNFSPNFDESVDEPDVLPARFPNLLVNGSEGIAVGMATNIPPHNLREVVNGVIMMIDQPDSTTADLMTVIKGPDFPTGAMIMGRDGIKSAYETGRGSVKMRARAVIEETPGGRFRIVVSEIPYQVNKARLIEQIAGLVRDGRVTGISDLRDESDRDGMRIVVELKRDANANVVMNQLFKYTQMAATFGVITLALVDGRPRVLTLREVIYQYLEHQKEVIIRRTRFDLDKAEARAHILEGLRIALDNIDRVVALIRASKTVDIAREGLMREFGLSEKQAQAILDMRLQRLTGLERNKIEEEYQALLKDIEYYRAVLASERMVYQIIRTELTEIRDKYGDDRRTKIMAAADDLEIEDLIPVEDMVITMTHQGYIKRLPASTYRSQRRGGRGITGMGTKEEDFVEHIFVTTTHHYIVFFTNNGRAYRLKVHEIPEAGRTAKGTNIVNLIQVTPGEKVTAVIPVQEFRPDLYLMFVTKNGTVKKTGLEEYENIRKGGLIALGLEAGDELIGVRSTSGSESIILVTRNGQSIQFPEEEVRPMGRAARGVTGIHLRSADEVVAMNIVREGADLLVITTKGFGKRTPLTEYRHQKRGGMGIKTLKITSRIGRVAGAQMVTADDEVILVTTQGVIIRLQVSGISELSRDTQGVKVQQLEARDTLVAVARVPGKEAEPGGEDEGRRGV